MRERAARLGTELRAERGLENAVTAIESIAAGALYQERSGKKGREE
jgi:hypothetical protein